MRKNNLFNRLFHKAEINTNKDFFRTQNFICNNVDNVFSELNECKTLTEVFFFHKRIWINGFRNENIGPCQYGMFRTQSIEGMKPEDVHLGGRWGLITENIPYWEKFRDEKYGANGFGIDPETSLYGMILDQYKNHLHSNIKAIAEKAREMVEMYKKLGY